MSARASPSAGRPSGILADNPEGSDGASEGGPTLMQGIPSKGSASSPAACWRRRVHARARTRARTPSRPRDVSAAGGSAGRRYGRLTKKEQNPPCWAGFKSLESRPSRKGSCVSQCRTPDAPEMRQCQTKSFLGNLVRFKTCNHDFRNSLKRKPSKFKRAKGPGDASARGFDRRGNIGETSRLIREFKPEETGVRAVAFASRLAPHHVVVPVPASRGFRILARRVGARSSVSVPLRAGFSGGCRGCGLVSNPSGTPSGQPPARASRVLFERRSPRRGGNLGRAVDAPEAAVR